MSEQTYRDQTGSVEDRVGAVVVARLWWGRCGGVVAVAQGFGLVRSSHSRRREVSLRKWAHSLVLTNFVTTCRLLLIFLSLMSSLLRGFWSHIVLSLFSRYSLCLILFSPPFFTSFFHLFFHSFCTLFSSFPRCFCLFASFGRISRIFVCVLTVDAPASAMCPSYLRLWSK